MAAAEYFSNAPMHQSSHQQGSTSYPQPQIYAHQAPSSAYLQASGPAPPPYDEHKPGVHFAPAPTGLPQRHSFSGQQRPQYHSPQPHNHTQLANGPSYNGMQHRPSQGYNGSPPEQYGSPQQKPQYLAPHMRPFTNPNASQMSLTNGGYSSDPEPQRRRRKHRPRRESGETRSAKSSSRSRNADAFVGAAGGGLIGDLIFPGLGTLGGAALGWFGGKDYGHHRKEREGKRHKEQLEWEQRYRPAGRSNSHEHRSRGSSTDIGEYDPRDSRGRRSNHH